MGQPAHQLPEDKSRTAAAAGPGSSAAVSRDASATAAAGGPGGPSTTITNAMRLAHAFAFQVHGLLRLQEHLLPSAAAVKSGTAAAGAAAAVGAGVAASVQPVLADSAMHAQTERAWELVASTHAQMHVAVQMALKALHVHAAAHSADPLALLALRLGCDYYDTA